MRDVPKKELNVIIKLLLLLSIYGKVEILFYFQEDCEKAIETVSVAEYLLKSFMNLKLKNKR